jgi:hypothetical protein
MFDWFRRRKEIIHIKSSELPQWFDHQISLAAKPLIARFEQVLARFNSEMQRLMQNADKLQRASLQNPDITVKEVQFMEGNRDAYLKKVRLFAAAVRFPSKISDLPYFEKEFSSSLDQFSKSSAKPYYVLQHFFAVESRGIAMSIKSLEGAAISAKPLHDQFEILHVPAFDEKIADLLASLQRKRDAFRKRKELVDEHAKKEDTLESLQEQRKKLLQSEKYRQLNEQKANLAELTQSLKETENQLSHEFATIEHALKKYSKITYEYEQIVDAYLQNHLKALHNDSSLRIIKVLHQMEESISREGIGLKDKKKEKTLASIETLKSHLQRFKNEHAQLSARMEAMRQEVDESITGRNLRDAEMAIRNCEIGLADIDKQLSRDEEQSIDVHIMTLKEELEKSFSRIFKKDFVIDLAP